MPYVEKAGVDTIKNQLEQWRGVMHDPNIDGFNGFACKQNLYQKDSRSYRKVRLLFLFV